MLYGVFSDIHANLEALNTVLDFFMSKNIKRLFCAGDIVGYGPNPNECTEIVRGLPGLSICVGNHDRAASGLKELTWFNDYAKKSLIWTAKTLTEANKMYLSELPKTVNVDGIMLVHGSPRDPLDEYLLVRKQYEENISHLTTDITVVGHTHVPFIFGHNAAYFPKDPQPLILEDNKKYIVNPGSVGQPRDGNNKAACIIFDTEKRELQLCRLGYDFSLTQNKMRGYKLPPFLVERLGWGK
jgi:predicted phosphodiesterase